MEIPALLTHVSTPPNSRTAVSPICSTASGSATSATTGVARPPIVRTSSAASCNPSSLRAARTRLAPLRAAMRAVASPMPLVAPVITMTCWSSGFVLNRMPCGVQPGCPSGLVGRGGLFAADEIVEPELLQSAVERTPAEAEHAGRDRLVAAGALERGEDTLAIGVSAGIRGAAESARRGGPEIPCKLPFRDELPFHEHACTLEDIAQLAHVARPVGAGQHALGCRRDAFHVLAKLLRELADERGRHIRDVLAALPQGWQRDFDHVQPVEQVRAEASRRGFGG